MLIFSISNLLLFPTSSIKAKLIASSSSTSLSNSHIPKFNGNNYEYWSIPIRVFFSSQDIWSAVENGYVEHIDATSYGALSQEDKDSQKDNRKKDSKYFFYIF